MAIIRKKELRTMDKKDVEKKMGELRLELAKERAAAFVGGSVKNPGRIREMKRTLARINTILYSGKNK